MKGWLPFKLTVLELTLSPRRYPEVAASSSGLHFPSELTFSGAILTPLTIWLCRTYTYENMTH